MNLVTDSKIPYVSEWFSPHFSITQLDSAKITSENIQHAEVLLVRSSCKVNRDLLEGSAVKIIASATSGFDHIDLDYVTSTDRQFFHAPGCNAHTVAEYVHATLACLERDNILKKPFRAGLIGVGRVGRAVAKRLQTLGVDLIFHDPPRALIDPDFKSVSLSEFKQCDFVSIHTPLTYQGPFATHHYLSEPFFKTLKPGCILVNAARGPVLDNIALLEHGQHLRWVLDVYDNEPVIDARLVQGAYLATPHIAGHSVESHWRGVKQIYQQIFAAFNLPWPPLPALATATSTSTASKLTSNEVLRFYDPRKDTLALKSAAANTQDLSVHFNQLRQHYKTRREFSGHFDDHVVIPSDCEESPSDQIQFA